jgi:DNA helicase-2/ATP-dependent DNA helicase PcrA
LAARARSSVAGFAALINELDSETLELPLEEMVEHIIHRTGLIDFHKAEKGERGQARVENLEELVSAAKTFRAEDETLSPVQQFLDSAALDAGDSQADPYEDSVQMMTLHSAKGLEFPLVILAGLEENLFPHRMSVEEPGRLEEERRLAYVGITRAQQKLLITYAESRRLHGSETYNTPSRFVREIPADLIEEVRLHGGLTRPLVDRLQQPIGSANDSGLRLGQRVFHPMFGEGMVLNIEGRGANARIEVNFGEGSKWLVLQYANLQAL